MKISEEIAKKDLHFPYESVKIPFAIFDDVFRNGLNRSCKEVPIMAKCEFCGKSVTFGIKVSHSHRRSNRTWKPNVKRVKAIVDGSPKRVYACTRCLRSGKVTRAV